MCVYIAWLDPYALRKYKRLEVLSCSTEWSPAAQVPPTSSLSRNSTWYPAMKVAISRMDLQGDPNRQSFPGVREGFNTIGFVLFRSRLKALSKSRYITALTLEFQSKHRDHIHSRECLFLSINFFAPGEIKEYIIKIIFRKEPGNNRANTWL